MPPDHEIYCEKIARVAQSHYQDAINIIDGKSSGFFERGDKKLRFLDIGSGSQSVLFAGLLKYLSEHNENKSYAVFPNTEEIEIHFLDRVNFTEIGIRPFVELLGNGVKDLGLIEEFKNIRLKGLSDTLRSYSFMELSEHLKKYDGITFKARFIEEDFNLEMGTAKENGLVENGLLDNEKFDIILINFAIHEILASSARSIFDEKRNGFVSLSPELFLEKLFDKIYDLLDEEGLVFLGDAYFPPYISSAFSKKVLDHLFTYLTHADAPIVFQHPEAILNVVFEKYRDKFELIDDKQFLIVINANDEGANGKEKFFRKSFFICLKKRNG